MGIADTNIHDFLWFAVDAMADFVLTSKQRRMGRSAIESDRFLRQLYNRLVLKIPGPAEAFRGMAPRPPLSPAFGLDEFWYRWKLGSIFRAAMAAAGIALDHLISPHRPQSIAEMIRAGCTVGDAAALEGAVQGERKLLLFLQVPSPPLSLCLVVNLSCSMP